MELLPPILDTAGGLGLFLLGMITLSGGLRDLAGAAIHRVLQRFTRSPASGALTGTLATAVVQSSSVTTLTAVGFASAGLLTFPEALGIVFGANVGTTLTGWIVALVGFKLKLGVAMPLLVLFGVLLRIFGRGKHASLGLALAGFGLAFLGIDVLRTGASAFEGIVTPASFPPDSAAGRLQLVGLGILFTLVTQSSSAGVATALAAIAGGAIEFQQAAALVIGMDVGTTVTAGVATVGASLPGRRTGWAHVSFNLLTGIGAFLLLPLFSVVVERVAPGFLGQQPELSLVSFHTCFNLLGVLLVLPFAASFAALVERLIPERPSPFTERLDERLLVDPEVALRALDPTLVTLADQTHQILRQQLDPAGARDTPGDLPALLRIAIAEVERYLSRIAPTPESIARRNAALHAVDQLARLLGRLEQLDRVEVLARDTTLSEHARRLSSVLQGETRAETSPDTEAELAQLCADLGHRRASFRDAMGSTVGPGALLAKDALLRMDAYRWLERVAHHSWRIEHHLAQLGRETPTGLVVEPPEPD